MNDVCAVIVTYNRGRLLCRCVQKLLEQSYHLDILIYDNHSTEDTRAELENNNLLKDNIYYYYAESNTGGAGGFFYGMRMASEKGYKYLWLMDDDGFPINEKTLSTLIDDSIKITTEDFILNSLVICDEQTRRLSFNLGKTNDFNTVKNQCVEGLYYGEAMPFNGTLLPVSLVKKIGYPMKEFFVYGDENEYCLRAQCAGAKLYTDISSLYFHPTNIQETKTVLGHKFYIMKMPRWKQFCASRNKMYIAKKYYGVRGVIIAMAKSVISIVVIPGDRIERLRVSFLGWHDALKEDFSRKIDFSQ